MSWDAPRCACCTKILNLAKVYSEMFFHTSSTEEEEENDNQQSKAFIPE